MSILFPTDFSENSAKAFEYALYVAKKLNQPITLLHVYPIPMPYPSFDETRLNDISEEVMTATERATSERMRHFKEELKQLYSSNYPEMVRTEEMLRMGFMGDELMHISEEIKASYIVMAVQHTSGLKRFFSGSSTMHILKKSKIPVITVPENLVFKAIKKIAYATDLTFNDNDILGRLLQIAELFDAEIKCFHVHDSNLEVENSIIQDFIVQYNSEIKQGLISFQLVDNVNVLDGIDFFVNEHEIDLLAVLKQKSYWLELEESMTKLLAFHTDIPLLVYHE